MDTRVVQVLVGIVIVALLVGGAVYYQQKKIVLFGKGYIYELPALPYDYDALEPYIDTQTMKLHHDRHHRAYVNALNAALSDHPELRKKPLNKLLENLDEIPKKVRAAVRDNGGGHSNHSFFWTIMAPAKKGNEPVGSIKELINKTFGDVDMFKKRFNKAALSVFGSGWAWLVLDTQGGLQIITTHNQGSPLSLGLVPLLGLDVWEHAYYLTYTHRRGDYTTAWWNVVNWKQVEDNYLQAIKPPDIHKDDV